MNQKEKALALIGSFVTGDTTVANELCREDYIQHNLAFGTGRDAFKQAVAGLQQAPVQTTVENIRAFEEGDKVFLHTIYNFAGAGPQVAFDVFRFEDGLIAEHWDNLATLTPANPSGHTQTDGPLYAEDLNKTAENKILIEGFIQDVLMGQNPANITSYIEGDRYIQHNSGIADGLTGLGAALEALANAGIQMIYHKTHQILGEGNMILAISHGTFGGAATCYYDLFRVTDGKITEHWDVMETIAEPGTWANKNGKY